MMNTGSRLSTETWRYVVQQDKKKKLLLKRYEILLVFYFILRFFRKIFPFYKILFDDIYYFINFEADCFICFHFFDMTYL